MKNWPYWVKGGIIFIVMALIILPFQTIQSVREAVQPFSTYTIVPLVYLFFGPSLLWATLYNLPSTLSPVVKLSIGAIITLIWVFSIGAFVGGLYRKIKNRHRGGVNGNIF